MPETAQRTEPFPAYAFYVQVDSTIEATFSQCSGLEVQVEVTEYPEGGENTYVHKLPGRVKYSDLTLRYGSAGSEKLWEWYLEVCQGQIKRKNISVIAFDQAGDEVQRWNLEAAYPIKWTGPEFNAAEGRVAIETLVLAHRGFRRGT